MTKLDCILKNRDITFPTDLHLVKAMVFPVVMYGCESKDTKIFGTQYSVLNVEYGGVE